MNSILKRRSVRTFNGDVLTEEQKNQINSYIADEKNLVGINGHQINIFLHEVNGKKTAEIGTHGLITDAPAFLIASCNNDKEALLDLGYVFEKIVLYLEGLDLNTCWLGGVFDVEELKQKAGLSSEKFIPVISPLGVKSVEMSKKEMAIRKFVNSDARKDFDELFSQNYFGEKVTDSSKRNILEMVRLAPSASNNQPWRVLVDNQGQAHFFIERTKGYGKEGIVKVDYDIQIIDLGIALAHYEIASGKSDYYYEDFTKELLDKNFEYLVSVR